MKGVYCLIIWLISNQKIKIGKLGKIDFKRGFYCYVGSGLNNLEKRIERHLGKGKKKRWHIDYFLQTGKIIAVKKIETSKKLECLLGKKIMKIANSNIKGFGCSDCKCKSHLYYFKSNPLRRIRQLNP